MMTTVQPAGLLGFLPRVRRQLVACTPPRRGRQISSRSRALFLRNSKTVTQLLELGSDRPSQSTCDRSHLPTSCSKINFSKSNGSHVACERLHWTRDYSCESSMFPNLLSRKAGQHVLGEIPTAQHGPEPSQAPTSQQLGSSPPEIRRRGERTKANGSDIRTC